MMEHDKRRQNVLFEITLRIMLIMIFIVLECLKPFRRKIHPEEMWLYKNPRTPSYVPTYLLWPIVIFIPVVIILVCNFRSSNKLDGYQAGLGVSLSIALNGVITNIVKLTVGRPRPDFFWRCFPDGELNDNIMCTGNPKEVIEGLKSFPSGHASLSFASLGFCFLYLCGKLHVFNIRGRGNSWRILTALLPLLGALLITISRTCDYHHHWQDVLVGSLLGFLIACLCYYQYYPNLHHSSCAIPLALIPFLEINTENALQEVTTKWI